MQDWDLGAANDSQQLDRELQVRICSRSPAVLRHYTKHAWTPYHHGVMSCSDLPVSLNCKLACKLPVVKQQKLMLHQRHGKSVRMVSIQLWQVTTGFLVRSWLKTCSGNFPAFLMCLTQSAWCAAFGYPCGLQLQSQEPEQLANTCNVLHTLLVQRQRDVSQRAQFDDHFQRMRSDLNVSEQTRDRLRSQLDAKQREHGTLLSQVGFVYLCLISLL